MAGSMPEVAKATVTIIPNMQGAQQAITQQMGAAASSAGTAASAAAGTSLAGGLATKLGALKGIMTKALPVAAVGAVGKALFDVGAEFDEMTDTIIVGTGASGKALEGLQDAAKGIATTVPISFGDAGDLVQDLNTRLGLTGDTLQQVGTQIAQVGDMTGEAFDTEAFAGAMSAWGTSAEDMSGQLDTLFAVSQSTGIGMNNLTGIVESSAPQMKTLGYSLEDTAAMAGLLDKAGLDASGTMSKMSKALTTIAKDGEEPADAMKRVTTEIGDYIKKGDEAGAINLAADLFGTKGATQFVAAVKSGSMSIDEFSAAMSDSSGIIGKTQEETMSFGERVSLLKNQFKELLEPMGSAIFKGMSTLMAAITRAFSQFTHGPGKVIVNIFKEIFQTGEKVVKTFTKAFAKAANLKSFGNSTKTVTNTVKKLFSALQPLVKVFLKLTGTVLKPLAKMVGTTLGVAFKAAIKIINLAATAVKFVSDRFVKLTSNSKLLKNAFDAVKKITGKAKEGFNTLKSAAGSVKDKFSSLKNIGDKVKSTLNSIKNAARAVKEKFDAAKSGAKNLASAVKDKLKGAFENVKSVIDSAKKKFSDIADKISSVKKKISDFKSAVGKKFKLFGGLKLPKITVSGGKAPWGIMGKGTKPSFGISWGARGGVLDSAQLIGIGAGEAGKEALIPLERNTGWADILAEKIGSTGNTYNVTLNAMTDESPEQYAQRFAGEVRRLVRMGAI